MIRLTASTRQPPAGGPGSGAHLDGLLQELRRGERDGFARYYRLFRSAVYDFSLRLLGDETAAVAATTEAFVLAFRQLITDEDAADLRVVTYRCALGACVDRAGAQGEGAAADADARVEAPQASPRAQGAGAGRFAAALDSLDVRRRAALLLHDLHGLRLAEAAAVFAVTEEAAGALLFRAREEFRVALAARSTGLVGGACRQAEQAAAGAVGQGLGDDELQRLRRHAAYCRPCRAVMKSWAGGSVGLAVLLEGASPPLALATVPVFGGAGASSVDVPAAAGAGVLGRMLRPAGRVLRGRAVAYVVAVACIALAAGVVLRQEGVRQFVVAESVGPAIRLVIQPPADRQPAKDRDQRASARPAVSGSRQAASPVAISQTLDAASRPAAQASPDADVDAPVVPRDGGSDTTSADGTQAPVADSSTAVEGDGAAATVPQDAESPSAGVKHVVAQRDGHRAHADRSTRSAGKPAHADRSARSAGKPAHADRSTRSAGKPAHADRSTRGAGKPAHADRSTRGAGKPAHADRSTRGAGKPAHADRSTRSAGKPAHADRSARSAGKPAHADRSARSAGKPAHADRSARGAAKPAHADRSTRSAGKPAHAAAGKHVAHTGGGHASTRRASPAQASRGGGHASHGSQHTRARASGRSPTPQRQDGSGQRKGQKQGKKDH